MSDVVDYRDLQKILTCVPRDVCIKVMSIRNAKEVEREKKASKEVDGKKQKAEVTETKNAETNNSEIKASEVKEESEQEGEKE